MVNSITFENFRGLKKLELPELSQITLLTGRNNAGKSSVLEGVFLTCTHVIPNSLSLICSLRRLPLHASNAFNSIFYSLDANIPITIKMEANGNSGCLTYRKDNSILLMEKMDHIQGPFLGSSPATFPYGLIFHFDQGDYFERGAFSVAGNPPDVVLTSLKTNRKDTHIGSLVPAYYLGSGVDNNYLMGEWIGQLELQGKKSTIISALNMIEPSICDFSMIVRQGQAQLYANTGKKLIPFKLMGDGTNRLLYILLAILENPNSVILIDEIESGFHYSVQEKLWNTVAQAAKESNCQIIAATHSYECIQNAVDGVAEAGMEEQFCLYRLEREGEENRAFRFSGELLHYAVDDNLEVR